MPLFLLVSGIRCVQDFFTGPAPPAAVRLAFKVQPGPTAAGSRFSPAVQISVLDSLGNTVTSAGTSVTVAVTGGTGTSGASLRGTKTKTAVGGVVSFSDLSIDSVGTGYTLTASAGGLSSATSTAFSINVAPPAKVAFMVQPSGATAGVAMAPAVQVAILDSLGNRVPSATNSITMTIGTNPAGGTLYGTTTATAVAGVATLGNLRIAKAGGGYTLAAMTTGLTGAMSNTFAISPGPPAQLAFIVQPSTTQAGVAITPSVQLAVEDSVGNTVPTATNTITVAFGTNPTAGTLSGTTTATAANGNATFSGISVDKVGTGYTLTAAAAGLAGATSVGFNITAGAASKLAFAGQPTSTMPGAIISPAVQIAVQDAFGNPVTTAANAVTVAIGTNPSSGTLSGTKTVGAVNGVAPFSNLSIDKVGAGYTLTATAATLTGVTSATFDIVLRKLAFTVQPSATTAGTAMTPAVQVTIQDSLGSTVTTATNGITLAIGTNPSGGTLSGTAMVNAVNGVATFSNVSIDKAGAGYTLGASASGIVSATSAAFTITAGAATQLGFLVQPSNATAGASIAPAVQVAVQDAYGNPVTSGTNSITAAIGTNPGGGKLSGTTTTTATNGVAIFSNLIIDKTGTGYTLIASATGLTPGTSTAFNVTSGAAARLVFTGQPNTAVAGVVITPAVQVTVEDTLGNAVTNATNVVTVAIGTNPGGGTLSGTMLSTAAVSGVATFRDLSINKAGTGYTLIATTAGLTGATSNAFNITAGTPTRLSFVVQPSDALSNTAIAPAVQVAVQDNLGNTVTSATNNITVVIGSNPASGALSGTTTVTAVNGVATFSTLSINNPGSGYSLTATATGLSSVGSSSFNITLYKLAFAVQPTTTTAGTAIVPAVQVAIQDASGSTVTSASNTIFMFIGSNPGSAYLYGTTSVAAVSGVATFSSLTIYPAATGYTLRASSTNLTGATSAAFNVIPGVASRLGFTVQPSNTTAGTAITPAVQVTVQDNIGNTVTNATNSITITIGNNPVGGTLSGTATASAVNGVATFSNLRLNRAGTNYTLTASATGLTPSGSNYFNVTVAPPSRLGFTVQPTRAVAGAAIAPAVQVAVQDSVGNTVPSATNGIAMAIGTNPSAGTLSGTTSVSATSGVAVFSNLIIDKTGSGYTLTASTSGLTSATSSAFDVVAPVTVRIGTIGAGGYHSCSITSGGVAYCWGNGGDGELGNGSTATSFTPVLVSGGLTFASVSLGYYHACGVTTSGVAYCWGGGGSGQLGNNSGANSTAPVPVSGGLTFASVSAGYFHTCGVTTGGAAYCWGYGAEGELGNGSTATSLTPVLVSGGLTFALVSAGNAHTCGVTTSGAAYCWGAGGDGQLGNGGTNSTTPVPVSGTLTFASVTAGNYHSCGVTTSGAAYCWGRNYYGELGNGSTAGSLVPTLVSGGLTFATMSAGNYDSCGIVTSGAAYCWGLDDHGQLGNGGTGSLTVPVLVSGNLTLTSLSAGLVHTCGITSSGAAYCWGDDEQYGRLGNGSAAGLTTPVPVSGGFTFSSLNAGAGHACAVLGTGVAACWGRGGDGQLGYGSTGNQPYPIGVSTALTFASVDAGGRHSCGVATGGAAYCWGYGGNGQLGTGATTNSSTPVAVTGGLSFASLDAGDIHTCGVTTTNAAYCWGQGDVGQLGSGSFSSSTVPVAVTGGFTFANVSAGYRHSCGVTTGAAAYCWGTDGSGQLGNGSTSNSASPVLVSGGLTFVSVSAGRDYSCGVINSGAGYCWGTNGAGQLGNGTTSGSSTPVLVSGSLTFASIKADSAHSCGVTTGGATYCWGANPSGELGTGSTTNSTIPVLVSGSLIFSSATAGNQFSCGLATDGAGYCWGLLAEGSLGNGSPYGSTTPVPVIGGLTFKAVLLAR